jgi:hypothetical protein
VSGCLFLIVALDLWIRRLVYAVKQLARGGLMAVTTLCFFWALISYISILLILLRRQTVPTLSAHIVLGSQHQLGFWSAICCARLYWRMKSGLP